MPSELTKPLRGREPRRSGNAIGIVLTAIGVLLTAGVVYTITSWDPGAPSGPATPIEDVAASADVVIRAPEGAENGVTITTPEGALPNGGVVIRPVDALGVMILTTEPDRALLENTADGALPKVAASGLRPFDAYARPPGQAAASSLPKIAIVIGGMGLNQNGTVAALARLPGEVSLAFASQADNLFDWAFRARDAGHELFLQVPFEPFDFPTNDPGADTLLVDDPVATNIDRLRDMMGRLTMYAGIITYAGGRFTGETDALQPVIDELGQRGLMLVDDGASPRSRTGEVAVGIVPYARADLVLDAVREPAAIADRLSQLEALARERGYAIASGSAFTATVEAVRSWAETARERGFELVPVTALAVDPMESTRIQVP